MSSETLWYVRNRGRVTGPFTMRQLELLVHRGQLARFHEVSNDRQTWQRAASVLSIFSAAVAESSGESPPRARIVGGDDGTIPLATVAPEASREQRENRAFGWYYGKNKKPVGPISFEELQDLANEGEIGHDTLVWSESLPVWVKASEIASLVVSATASVEPPEPPEMPLRTAHPMVQPAPAGPVAVFAPSPAPYVPARTSGLAVASLVLSLLWLAGFGSLLAIIFGGVAVGQIGKSSGLLTGKGMAWAGVILGILGLTPLVYVLIFALSGLASR